jgi:hypothetical protein
MTKSLRRGRELDPIRRTTGTGFLVGISTVPFS